MSAEGSLPHLPVLREKYCSQQVADNLVAFLESNRPDLIQEYKVSNFDHVMDYDFVLDALIRYIKEEASKKVVIPDSKLGRLDFSFELLRRISKKFNLKEPEIYGTELPFPLPHWPKVKVYGEEVGITHNLVENALTELYVKQPDLVFATAEAIRRSLLASEIKTEMHMFLKTFIHLSDREPNRNLVSKLQGNINCILAEMMELPVKQDRK